MDACNTDNNNDYKSNVGNDKEERKKKLTDFLTQGRNTNNSMETGRTGKRSQCDIHRKFTKAKEYSNEHAR